jgi:hypothetical protein
MARRLGQAIPHNCQIDIVPPRGRHPDGQVAARRYPPGAAAIREPRGHAPLYREQRRRADSGLLHRHRRVASSLEGLARHAKAGNHGIHARDDSRYVVDDDERHREQLIPELRVVSLDQSAVVVVEGGNSGTSIAAISICISDRSPLDTGVAGQRHAHARDQHPYAARVGRRQRLQR